MDYLANTAQFYWFQFLTGFCANSLLPIILLLAAAVLCGWVGRDYGLPNLIRLQKGYKPIFSGLSLAALCCKVMLVGYLLAAVRANDRGWAVDGPQAALQYILGTLTCLAGTVGAFYGLHTFLHLATRDRPFPRTKRKANWAPFIPFFISFAIIVAAFVILLIDDGSWLGVLASPKWVQWSIIQLRHGIGPEAASRPPDYYLAIAIWSTLVMILLYALVAVIQLARPKRFSAATPVLIAADIGTAAYGYLCILLPEFLPVLVLILGVVIIFLGARRYPRAFPNLHGYWPAPPIRLEEYARRSKQSFRDVSLLPGDKVAFNEMDFGAHRRGMKRPLVLLCVSGGGLSAAGWTFAICHQLEESFQKAGILFPYHVRVIAGASGGMMAAAYYSSTLPPPGTSDGQNREVQFNRLCEDALSPVITQMVYGDFLGLFPIKQSSDRGLALEQAWRQNLGDLDAQGRGPLDRTFLDMLEGEKAGWRPSLIFSPMLVEDGRRLLISNLDLDDVARNNGHHGLESSKLLSIESYEFFRLFHDPQTRRQFTLGTAARMSASFPFVSPAVSLPTIPRRRVVDAGYFDNFGVGLAVGWLSENREWIKQHASGVALVRIRNNRGEEFNTMQPTWFQNERLSTPFSRGCEELTSPLEGVLQMRNVAATFRNDERLELLSRHFKNSDDSTSNLPYFTTFNFEMSHEVSLSWCLTDEERQEIWKGATEDAGVAKEIGQFLQWWQRLPLDVPVGDP